MLAAVRIQTEAGDGAYVPPVIMYLYLFKTSRHYPSFSLNHISMFVRLPRLDLLPADHVVALTLLNLVTERVRVLQSSESFHHRLVLNYDLNGQARLHV